MFAYIIGEVQGYSEGNIILENNGIGYQIATSTISMSHFQVGETYKIHTIMHVRDDGICIYGFYSEEEKEMFELLVKVSSIGPKSALSILSAVGVVELRNAILNSDISMLTKAPGIGKKTAGRIILELIDPIKKLGYVAAEIVPKVEVRKDAKVAIDALVNLGYPKNEAEKAIRAVDTDGLTLEEIIRKALQKLA